MAVTDALIEPVVDPYAELAEVTVYGRQWGKDPEMGRPAPVITSTETYAAGWCWWPRAVVLTEKRAVAAGWAARIGFARGYKPGRRKGTWSLLDIVGLWLLKPDAPRAVFTWERSPETEANAWKAGSALLWSGPALRAYGHTEAKALIL